MSRGGLLPGDRRACAGPFGCLAGTQVHPSSQASSAAAARGGQKGAPHLLRAAGSTPARVRLNHSRGRGPPAQLRGQAERRRAGRGAALGPAGPRRPRPLGRRRSGPLRARGDGGAGRSPTPHGRTRAPPRGRDPHGKRPALNIEASPATPPTAGAQGVAAAQS